MTSNGAGRSLGGGLETRRHAGVNDKRYREIKEIQRRDQTPFRNMPENVMERKKQDQVYREQEKIDKPSRGKGGF